MARAGGAAPGRPSIRRFLGIGALVLLSSCTTPHQSQPRSGQNPLREQGEGTPAGTGPVAAATAREHTAEGSEASPSTASAGERVTPLQAALDLGKSALDENRLDAAREHYQRARDLDPSHPAAELGLLKVRWAKLGLPTAYAEAPRHPEFERLVAAVDAILAAHPEHAPALLEKGRLLLVLGDAPGAFSSLNRAAAIQPDDPETHSALAVAYLATGQAQLALDHFELSAKLAPNEPERLTNLGTAYMLRGRVSEAISTYQRALALQPDDPRTNGDLGAAYLADNRVDKAVPHLVRATTLAPERATFLTNLGYAYQRQGQLDKAIETQRRALALDPKLVSAWINLGNALAERQKYEEAEAALRHAESLDPSDPRPKSSLRDLAELRARPAERPPH